ncbi:ATPase [Collibacillus ludicampi]|uniref:ATPase n=1 Tax=Collibacillus ludicampi TaxID=2771369 RepID=A0AAV4LBU4_9BACL|nr:SRPBCC family protein [Collibacillus ludicampi]GIM45322.1 ATPase [Collibacillus ludicampi]
MNFEVKTKIKILKPVSDVFEAIVDPAKMSNYWFSSGSGRLEQGKTVTLRYDEYDAKLDIKVIEYEVNKKIVYLWSASGEETVVTITLKELDTTGTIIEVNEKGWKKDDDSLISKLLGQKEGWVYVLTCLKAYLEFGVNLRGALVF